LGFISNLYAAITIGKYFEVDENSIKEALESYIPENNRSQLLTKGSNKIILGCWIVLFYSTGSK
jgi:UDP-N-acetylmuramoyl-tripeptide--D-alanyl-D-alanine ligase